ncbi:DUF4019 domain-containing protein [Gilvimarinus xylanilyticus]|uniref:DUF3887 domain-containing protein n=1 Tax=Gilvimarinus xylanilyticus TaxID=2944139 RepID=A0A9X2I1K9_9GAMM|nr:DUF4019 domain-containing protein [Gilvimarinus xylanilyticus]MCP8900451.1 DUF3887 domain-containing protein [Gilvimarinus xylanilyticus]
MLRRLTATLLCLLCFHSVRAYEPSPQERQNAQATALQYIEHLNAGEYREAYDMHSELLNQRMDYERFAKSQAAFSDNSGKSLSDTLVGANWQLDPAKAPAEGFYVEYEIACEYQYLKPCAQTLVLYSELGERFRVMRHSRSYVNTQTGKRVGQFIEMPGNSSRL